MTDVPPSPPRRQLKIRRVNLDTGRESVAVISRRSTALRPDVFRAFSRVELRSNSKVLLATLLLTDDGMVAPDEPGLAEPAFRRFGGPVGSPVTVTPATPPESLDAVRAKIQGRVLSDADMSATIEDITHHRYSEMEIAAFLIGSASFMTSGAPGRGNRDRRRHHPRAVSNLNWSAPCSPPAFVRSNRPTACRIRPTRLRSTGCLPTRCARSAAHERYPAFLRRGGGALRAARRRQIRF